jgi:hypothetical protein
VGEQDVGPDELRAALDRQLVELVERVGVVLEVLRGLARRQRLGMNAFERTGTMLDRRRPR